MAVSKGTSHDLHSILNSLEKANKKDCIDFSHGHLNENKLLKFADKKSSSRSWASAQKAQIVLTPGSHLPKLSGDKVGKVPMQDALLKFSIGTNGTIPVPPTHKKTKKTRSDLRKKTERQSSYMDDGILIEEFVSRDPVGDFKLSPRTEMSPRYGQDFGHAAITKRDQYIKRQILETDVVRKQDAREQNVLSGHKAVEHLEYKLKRELDQLDLADRGPNFHRLQIYGNIFEDLLSESTTFGPVLRTIKSEYDEYTAYLLDNNPTQHHLLHEQIKQMHERKVTPDCVVGDEKRRLMELEIEAELALSRNKALREAIEREKRGEFTPEPLSKPPTAEPPTSESPPHAAITDRIQTLRASILEHLDDIQSIRKDLRQHYEPVAVVNHLEQCIKETEVENQNVARRNEVHQESIDEIVESLAEEIKKADTNEGDEKRIWRRLFPKETALSSSKSESSGRLSASSTRANGTPSTRTRTSTESDSDSDDDDTKWNWYIS